MDEAVMEHLETYFMERTRESYLQLRQAVMDLPSYDPYGDSLHEADTLLERKQYQEAMEFLRSRCDNWFLTPRVHQMLSYAHAQSGDAEGERMEEGIGLLLLQGILTTGDGSETRPYLVTRVEHEYDVLGCLEKSSQGQALVHRGEQHFDVHHCEDGSSVWFDITAQYDRLQQSSGSNSSA